MRLLTAAAACAVVLIGSTDMVGARTICQQVGNQTYCSDGQVFERFGNTIYDRKGHTWQEFGNQTYGSDGTLYQRYDNQTFVNRRGVIGQHENNRYDSTSCELIGAIAFCK
jgi:hypothetical protein